MGGGEIWARVSALQNVWIRSLLLITSTYHTYVMTCSTNDYDDVIILQHFWVGRFTPAPPPTR